MEQRPSNSGDDGGGGKNVGKNGDKPDEPAEEPTPDLAETVDIRSHQPPEPERPRTEASKAERKAEPAAEPPESRWFASKQSPDTPGPGGTADADPLDDTPEEEPGAERAEPAEPAAEEPHHTHHASPTMDPVSAGRSRLVAALWPPRLSRNQAVVGVLLAVLGAALAIQVRATNSSDQLLRAARPDDLVHILDEVTARGQRLDTELRDLESQKASLQNSTDKAQAALQQAQEKAKDLQILAGTVKATGPGITVTVTDPQHKVDAAALLNALQELRAAGAEVVQLGNVRIVVSSAFLDAGPGQVTVDGHTLTAPYVFKVIGDPATLQPALGIPGGVVASLKNTYGATTAITSGKVLVDAVAPQPDPQYAKAG